MKAIEQLIGPQAAVGAGHCHAAGASSIPTLGAATPYCGASRHFPLTPLGQVKRGGRLARQRNLGTRPFGENEAIVGELPRRVIAGQTIKATWPAGWRDGGRISRLANIPRTD